MHFVMALIIASLSIGCASADAPEFPDIKKIYELDAVKNKIIPYPVVKKTPWTLGEQLPDEELFFCDGCVVIKYDDYLDLLDYKIQAEEFVYKYRKCFKR